MPSGMFSAQRKEVDAQSGGILYLQEFFRGERIVWNVRTNAFYAKKEQDFLERKRRRGLENVICFGLRRYAA